MELQMKVKKVLELLDVIEDIPSDMRDIIYPEDTDMQMEGAYFSASQQKKITIGDMDIVHVIRAFKKVNELYDKAKEGWENDSTNK